MTTSETTVTSLLREFALSGDGGAEAAAKIIGLALTADELSTSTAVRIAELMDRYPDALRPHRRMDAAWAARMPNFRSY